MKVLNVIQGTPEWLEARKGKLTASLAPEIMGDGYGSYSAAIEKFLGIDKPNLFMAERFKAAHEAEDAARAVFEAERMVLLSPLVAERVVDGLALFASFDGITFDNDLVWEHKHTKKTFDEQIQITKWQLEHQMLVADCDYAVLTITNPDTGEITHYDYECDEQRQDQLLKKWKKFIKDVAAYERNDASWKQYAALYREFDYKEKVMNKKKEEAAAKLRELAGKHTSRGAGVTVSVTERWTKTQTAADYVKENGIKLAKTELEEPDYAYRILVDKDYEVNSYADIQKAKGAGNG